MVSLAIAPVVALNVADVVAAATVTEVGSDSAGLVSLSVTLAPPAGAAFVSVTVQVLDALGPRLAGLHDSDDTNTGATSVTVALAELPL